MIRVTRPILAFFLVEFFEKFRLKDGLVRVCNPGNWKPRKPPSNHFCLALCGDESQTLSRRNTGSLSDRENWSDMTTVARSHTMTVTVSFSCSHMTTRTIFLLSIATSIYPRTVFHVCIRRIYICTLQYIYMYSNHYMRIGPGSSAWVPLWRGEHLRNGKWDKSPPPLNSIQVFCISPCFYGCFC